ncbi:MAG: RidA family protein [Chloroflexota bacterium]
MNEPRILGKPVGAFSPGLVAPAGQLVFLSGQVALDAQGKIVGAYDVGAQTRFIFGKIQALLEEAGGSLASIVKLTTFMTDMRRFSEFGAVRDQLFTPPYPASSTVQIGGLTHPEMMLSIDAIAVLPARPE